MKKLSLLLFFITLFILQIQGQEEEPKFGIAFSGFVKSDFFFDSRQTVAAREGHFLLWPAAENNDINGVDANAVSNFNFLAVQSRLSGQITGPDAFGAKTSGLIEGDFFAQHDANINLFRLRHAYVKLNWEKTEIIAGQTWNPLFVTGCFPGTVSFNTGTPLQSFARNPQLRVTYTAGPIKLIGAALAQRDYTSRGPNGISSEYLRNSGIPDLHAQVHYEVKPENAGFGLLTGIGVAYKSIVPKLRTDSVSTSESVEGLTVIAFSKITLKPVTIKIQGRYGENIADVLSISGFAVKDTIDAANGVVNYTPLTNATIWGEIHTNGKKVQVGIFGGYLKNLGTKEEMSTSGNPVYGLGTNISSLLRISPRVMFISNKTKLACELEYTSAAYGDKDTFDKNYVPESTTTVSNLRVLCSVIYSF